MTKYTIKRLLQSLITVLAIVTIVFLLMRMLPPDYYFTEDQVMKLTEEAKNDQLRAAGLLDPLPVQLFRFYGRLARLDFGTSRRLHSRNAADFFQVYSVYAAWYDGYGSFSGIGYFDGCLPDTE